MTADSINLGQVIRCVGMDRQKLIELAGRADRMYRRTIRKTGTKNRVIDEPRPELKSAQRALCDGVLKGVPISRAVYGVRGKGVIENAQRHLAEPYMGVLDIADCFPSITSSMVRTALVSAGFDAVAARYVTRLVTLRGRLPQGSPSSPAIMNLVLAEVDAELDAAAYRNGCTYSRYADDICFSGPRDLAPLLRLARATLRRHKFSTNPLKAHCWGPTNTHTLTNIVVSSELNPTVKYVTALKSEIENVRAGRATISRKRFDGRMAWIRSLNPDLAKRLQRRVQGEAA